MRFVKMEGLGNDYVYLDAFRERVSDPAALAVRVSDRHFGIGADGLILIEPSDRADARMVMFNADGSRGRMCGNGIRCVAKYLWDHGIARKDELVIETDSGLKTLKVFIENGAVARVSVNMGRPMLERSQIPMRGAPGRVIDEPLQIAGRTFRVTAVNMGNPHCVTFVDDVSAFDLKRYGPLIEGHAVFPERVNAEFAQVIDRSRLKMRVWERGSGETLACGTGACAMCVAASLNDLADREVTVELLGGELHIRWSGDTGEVIMTGPAREVFTGEWPDGA